MSGNSWRNGVAVGLTFGISTTIVVLLFGDRLFNVAACVMGGDQCTDQRDDAAFSPNTWLYWTKRLIAAEDSLAQWVIAFLSFLAVMLLWLTLRQAIRTNDAAVAAANAANVANELMRSEQRPWLTLRWQVSCEYLQRSSTKYSLKWFYNVENLGKSPAFNVRVSYNVYRYDWSFIGAGRQAAPIEMDRAKRSTNFTSKVLFPNQSTEFIHHPEWSILGTIDGHDEGTLFLCVSIAYDLDHLGTKVGHETRVLVLERQEEQFGPMAHRILNVSGYQVVE
ncbi:hypothetical protein [Marivita sp. GX14005]|uniref:hypothetical protein n=1 Tax=Marivita sp. GX14005 TaxID=2942276 RepID=UPI002018D700|nr:hypothetical protein [Marivita sp. GX14005]MCL3882472.1 hypothetical protein [Marivita sp. GX14005]